LKKVLIIQTAFIGDVILATPLVSELVSKYPQIEIDFLVRKGNESLLANQPNVKTVYTLDKKKGKFKQIVHFVKTFRQNRYDEIINLHRFASSGIITILSRAKKTVGFNKNPLYLFYTLKVNHEIGNGEHEIVRNLRLIKHHGCSLDAQPKLFPSNSDFEFVKKYKEKTYYCLAPSSVWFTKQLPKEKWIELINSFKENESVYLLGGPGDKNLCEEIISNSTNVNCQNLAGELSFLQSSALMVDAKMNFVNDSGPLHICSAMNAPVSAFFCSTTPLFGFGPTRPNGKVIETEEKLDCKPCGLHGHKACPKGHFKCGNTINIKKAISNDK
jgi:lipopolysaccharide heptosyltransferase II